MATQPNEEAPEGKEARIQVLIPKACGYCRNCNLPVDDHIVFCEPFCERQYLHERGAGPAPVR
jgi:hypothetical protein